MILSAVIYNFLLLLGILATLASLYSLHLGRAYGHQVHAALRSSKTGYSPQVCVIMPCKGDDIGLSQNIESVLKQNYPNYHVIMAFDSINDPAYKTATSLLTKHPRTNIQLCISRQRATRASGKVSALLTAFEMDNGISQAYAFVDSDAYLPSSSWLFELVDPLMDSRIGATTGFRWYIPDDAFCAHTQAAWNALGTNLMFDDKYNFPWGGAMAVRAETLDKIQIQKVWSDAISDDLALNTALRKHGYKILFLPQCTVATFTERTTLSNLLKWTTNQITLTKTYNKKLWHYALIVYAFFDFTFITGLLAFVMGLTHAPVWFASATLLLSPLPIGIIRSWHRFVTFQYAIPMLREHPISRLKWSLASLIVPWVMTFGIFKSTITSEIDWRETKYKLRKG
ncbi:MAG: glycosyltransferase family 2 protein [Candidatus Bathyarchaeia archaeon]|jgi:cellulose synthase/poly-beta-1,6-N-acetylglucosamine synthase-like glycosyltransferase